MTSVRTGEENSNGPRIAKQRGETRRGGWRRYRNMRKRCLTVTGAGKKPTTVRGADLRWRKLEKGERREREERELSKTKFFMYIHKSNDVYILKSLVPKRVIKTKYNSNNLRKYSTRQLYRYCRLWENNHMFEQKRKLKLLSYISTQAGF